MDPTRFIPYTCTFVLCMVHGTCTWNCTVHTKHCMSPSSSCYWILHCIMNGGWCEGDIRLGIRVIVNILKLHLVLQLHALDTFLDGIFSKILELSCAHFLGLKNALFQHCIVDSYTVSVQSDKLFISTLLDKN